ncbi:MAG: 3-deoxy-manno-octulosonate cytidylyltransferase [Bacteroidetes bacterium]|nr:3-deoxy-manno-octulosonate cytidylyltransferase [Bacteroidota bacterium]
MIITGVIPARFASTRFPGKPLITISGKSMIQRVYEQAQKSKLISSVIVATDDKRIFECVNSFGGEAVMTSPKHRSGTDRIHEAVKNIKCGIVVNIQGDEPFIEPDNIDMAIEPLLKDKKLNVSTLAVRIRDLSEVRDPGIVKVIFDRKMNTVYFSRGILPYNADIADKKADVKSKIRFYKHIGLYVYRKKFLSEFVNMKKSQLEESEKLEQLRIIENGEKIRIVITGKDSVSVDTPDDLKRILRNL